jgi:hypothetical protein
MSNPALVSDSLAGFASAGYTFYVADIGQSTFTYAHPFKKIGVISFGVQHINYGEIEGYDAAGQEIGSFTSGETAVVISKSHRVSHFTMGISIKGVFSTIAGFRSNAVMLDIGGTFRHPTQDLTAGLVFKNLGFAFSEYSETSDTEVPFDVQAGVTFKPEHMPLRFSLTAYNLATSGDAYDNPDDPDDNPGSIDKLMRHINFGAEILFHKNVHVLLGYNVLRRQELKNLNAGSGAGITFGAALNIKSFDIVFSRSGYTINNGAYAFTVSANVNKMIFKRRG